MTQQHFTINLSRRLQEIGVELPETEKYWHEQHTVDDEEYNLFLSTADGVLTDSEYEKIFPALSFSDLLSLMPKVGEKCGLGRFLGCSDSSHVNKEVLCPSCHFEDSWQESAHNLLDHFLAGLSDGTSWERAEAYFMSITEKK